MARIFFFNDTATTEIYTLSLHDALPILSARPPSPRDGRPSRSSGPSRSRRTAGDTRSEEHTSELQSLAYLVCRLLLEKKNQRPNSSVGSLRRPRPSLPLRLCVSTLA